MDFVWAIIILVVVIIGGALWLDSSSCHARWELSGKKVSWGPLQGCLVQRENGTWISDKYLRDMKMGEEQ
jgi:hypothetical protein